MSPIPEKSLKHQVHLDAARGLAALAVALNHLRNFLFVDYSQVPSPSLWDRFFYFATGIGRESVMVFFVLSGFLIGGSVLKSLEEGKWSWRIYFSNRLSRLWAVLIPALLLGLLWDTWGASLTGGAGYDGRYGLLVHSGPSPAAHLAGGWWCLLGNVFFLQTVLCPVFGSNSPLWSLANEFWYYLLFPLLAIGLLPGIKWGSRFLPLALAGALFFFLPGFLLALGAVWLMGVAAYRIGRVSALGRWFQNPWCFGISFTVFVVCLALSKAGKLPGAEYWIGGAFACSLPFLASRNSAPGWYQAAASWLSNISYSLYLAHFPLLAFYFFHWGLPGRVLPSGPHYLLFLLFSLWILAYAFLVWRLFERQTPRLRELFLRISKYRETVQGGGKEISRP
jgi:peptidoglycan/LPS O-acetylase OafA/YrhL